MDARSRTDEVVAGADAHMSLVLSNVDVVYGGVPFRAEIVEDTAERERLWNLADRVYPQYATFRDRAAAAGRTIPMVRLVPR